MHPAAVLPAGAARAARPVTSGPHVGLRAERGRFLMTAPVTVISFGYGHGPAPRESHAIFDVRHHFKDPHVSPELRYLTARDRLVVEAVLNTPGVPALFRSIAAVAVSFLAAPQPGPVTIAVGCAGGRHRSAVIAAAAAEELNAGGIPVTLQHRDLERPVIERPAGGTP